jgi:multisubunit Na+/H+ antiporter MnhB subunit
MFQRDSFILRKTATTIALIVQVFAVYLFFRGHELPGGGFIAGVCSGVGVLLLIMANGSAIVTRICPFDPLRLCAWGLAVATSAGLCGMVISGAFLTHYHYKNMEFPILGSLYLGTPQFFDLGVYMVVVGVVLKVTLVLMDALEGQIHIKEPAYRIPMAGSDRTLEDGHAPDTEGTRS